MEKMKVSCLSFSLVEAEWKFYPLMQIYCCSVAQLCPTLCDPMDYSTPGLPVAHYLPKFAEFMSIELVMLSNHICNIISGE